MKELVSIIIPVYNAENVIKKGVESALAQTYQNYEIILVNDGSSDNSFNICKQYEKKYSCIKVINKKNEGAGAARNAGLRIAKGAFIYFMDCDDWIERELLEILIAQSGTIHDGTIAICPHFCEESNGKIQNVWKVESDFLQWNSRDVTNCIANMDKSGVFNYLWNKLYKKAIIDMYDIKFDNQFTTGQDLDFNIKYFYHVTCCNKVSKPLYHYIKNGTNSLCARYKKNLYEIVSGLCERRKQLYQYYNMIDNLDYKNIYEATVVEYYMSCIPNMYRKNSGLKMYERRMQIKQLLSNRELYEYCYKYKAKSRIAMIFVKNILAQKVFKMELEYSLLFFIRNNFTFIYEKLK